MHSCRKCHTTDTAEMYISEVFRFKHRPDLCMIIESTFGYIASEIEAKHGKHNLTFSKHTQLQIPKKEMNLLVMRL